MTNRKIYQKYVGIVLLCLFVFTPRVYAKNLEKVARNLVEEISKGVSLKGQKVCIFSSDITAQDGFVYPLSQELREEIVYFLTNKIGAEVVPDLEEASYYVTGKYSIGKRKVKFWLKLIDKEKRMVVKEAREDIDRKEVAHLLQLNLSSYALYLTHKLAENLPFNKKIRLLVLPLKYEDKPVYPLFSRRFLKELRLALEKVPVIEIIASEEFQKRVRAIRKVGGSRTVSNLTIGVRGIGIIPGHTAYLGAHLVKGCYLHGSFWKDPQGIKVFIEILDNHKRQLSSAAVNIPYSIIPDEWLRVDTDFEGGGIAKNLFIDIVPDRGEGSVYYHGEEISFLLSANKPAHFYIYDYDPAGHIVRLYPCSKEEENISFHTAVMPGVGTRWIVQPPFGTDRVLVFATQNPIPLPTNRNCGEVLNISLKRLYRYYRQFQNIGYAEAVATIITKESSTIK